MQNKQSELAVLCGVAKYGLDAYNDIEDLLTLETFTEQEYKCVFQVLQDLCRSDISVNLPSFLSTQSKLHLNDAINQELVEKIFNANIALDTVRPLAQQIKRLEITRDLNLALREASSKLHQIKGDETLDYILSLVENPIVEVQSKLDGGEDQTCLLFENIEEFLDLKLENPVDQPGIPTGYDYYDSVIGGGLRPGYTNMIVARPKGGKSTLALHIAMNIASGLKGEEIPVLLLDTEMEKKSQLERAISSYSRASIREIETGKFAAKEHMIYKKAQELSNIPFYYRRVAGKPFHEILSIMRRWYLQKVGKGNPAVVIYDYFKLMDTKDMADLAEHQALGYQLMALNDFIGHYELGCLTFTQANRDGISSETTDIVAQSDRLLWFVASLCLLRKKSTEEITNDGLGNGNRKLIPMDGMRFSSSSESNGFINFMFDYDCLSLEELGFQKNQS